MTQAQPSAPHSRPLPLSGSANQNTSSTAHPDTASQDAASTASQQTTTRQPPLVKEAPTLVYPTLARVLGINEAIVIQQIYFHINVKSDTQKTYHFHEERWWVYNSYEEWCQQHFPWLSPRGLQSIMMNLEEKGIVLSLQGVRNRWDRRKWYTLNLTVLSGLLQNEPLHESLLHHTKNVSSMVHFLHDVYTESTTERETTNESRSENSLLNSSLQSPNGDACVSENLLSKSTPVGEMLAEEPGTAKTTLVEANDSSESRSLRSSSESSRAAQNAKPALPRPVLDLDGPATPSRPVQPSSARLPAKPVFDVPRPASAPVSRPAQSNSEQARFAPPAAKPVLEVPQSASVTLPRPAQSDSERERSTPPVAKPPFVPTPHSQSPMQVAVVYALKVYGGHAGKIGQFFKGTMPHSRKDLWAHHQPDIPATPQEVLALLMWYRQHPAYAVSCTEHGGKLPSTPAILRDRLDEFRDSPDHNKMIEAARPLLERLMRGEKIVVPVSEKPMGRVESAEAYKPYDPSKDPVYRKRNIEPISQDILNQIFGVDDPSSQTEHPSHMRPKKP